jgi:hypothetical protein
LKQIGRTGKFERPTTPGVPAGSTDSISADGVARFKKSNIVLHPCHNPSVYTDTTTFPAGHKSFMLSFDVQPAELPSTYPDI